MALASSPLHARSSTQFLKRAAPRALPEQVAWLQHVSLQLSARSASDFDLCVRFHDSKTETSWTLARAFNDFRALQKRLLRALHAGHACHAECAWLYAVVKKHFPKRSLLLIASQAKAQERERALLRVLTTLQASLLNRGNHGCSVLLDQVSREVTAFLVGGCKCDDASSLASDCRDSLSSLASSDEDECSAVTADSDSECGLCRRSLDCVELHVSASASACRVCCVTTAFSCGHQFHDACLTPAAASASISCPACGLEATA